jgi:putative cardiolipin synthase
VLSEAVREKLEAAGRRGVQIDLLTNSPASTDSALTQAFFLRQWPSLLARIPNMRIFVFAGAHKLHAKTGFADNQVAAIGSFNLDIISSDINGEAIALTRSPAIVRELEQAFRNDMADPANNVLEYTIQRDAQGRPVLRNGEPIITFGPANHVSPNVMRFYNFASDAAEYATRRMPQLSPLTESQPTGH